MQVIERARRHAVELAAAADDALERGAELAAAVDAKANAIATSALDRVSELAHAFPIVLELGRQYLTPARSSSSTFAQAARAIARVDRRVARAVRT